MLRIRRTICFVIHQTNEEVVVGAASRLSGDSDLESGRRGL